MNFKRVFVIGFLMFVAVGVWAYIHFLHYTPPQEPDDLQGTIAQKVLTVDRLERQVSFYVPKTDRPAAIVFVLHGSQGDGAQARAGFAYSWDRLADQYGFIVAYPTGFENHWNDCRREGDYSANHQNIDDIKFFREMVAHAKNVYGLTGSKIYATGLSNGGHMALRLALEAPEFVTAVAPFAAALPAAENMDCEPAGVPVPIMITQGTDDPLVPARGGYQEVFGQSRGEIKSLMDGALYWVKLAGHDESETDQRTLENIASDDGSTIDRHEWRSPNGLTVVLNQVKGGGHTIPNLSFNYPRVLGRTNHDVDGAQLAWQFFNDQ